MHGFPSLSIGVQKVDKSRNRFHIFMIVKVHGVGMGDSMVIKTDEIKAEMVNYENVMKIPCFETTKHLDIGL